MISEASQHHMDESPSAEIVPIEAARSEVYDFSKAPIEVSVEFLLSQLRHPSHSSNRGLELAAFLERELTPDESRSPTTPQENLAQAIRFSDAFEDDVFEERLKSDAVFRELISKLKQTSGARSLKPQRHAALKLTELRAVLPRNTTELDDEWENVIERLFT